jgi:hypothetical protein
MQPRVDVKNNLNSTYLKTWRPVKKFVNTKQITGNWNKEENKTSEVKGRKGNKRKMISFLNIEIRKMEIGSKRLLESLNAWWIHEAKNERCNLLIIHKREAKIKDKKISDA